MPNFGAYPALDEAALFLCPVPEKNHRHPEKRGGGRGRRKKGRLSHPLGLHLLEISSYSCGSLSFDRGSEWRERGGGGREREQRSESEGGNNNKKEERRKPKKKKEKSPRGQARCKEALPCPLLTISLFVFRRLTGFCQSPTASPVYPISRLRLTLHHRARVLSVVSTLG